MQRVDSPTAAASLPAPATTVSPGYFTNGNPATAVPATIPNQDWFNSVQEELMSILAAAGVAPSKTVNNQVLAALRLIFPMRKRLTANTTFYVNASTGSDSNDGLTPGGAWLTLQNAWNQLASNYDLNGFTATVSCSGAFTAGVIAIGPLVGGVRTGGNAPVIFQDAGGSTISCTNGSCFIATDDASIGVSGFTLSATGSGSGLGIGLWADIGATIRYTGTNFGACAQAHILATNSSTVLATGSYTISGSSPIHYTINHAQVILTAGITITLTGTPAFSTGFVQSTSGGMLNSPSAQVTFSGSATGVRYIVTSNGIIQTNGGGATYLPGSIAGTTATGGIYV